MKTSFDPVVLRKRASEYERMAKKHYDLAKAIEASGLYHPTEKSQVPNRSKRSAEFRKQASERMKRFWAEKRKAAKQK